MHARPGQHPDRAYPSQHGAWSLGTKLDEHAPTVSGRLAAAGYATALVGKAHFQPLASRPGWESLECQPTLRDLDFWRNFHGPWYGFERVEVARMHAAESHVGQHYALWMEEKGFANWRDYFEDWPPNPEKRRAIYASRRWALPEEFHYTVWTGEKTIAEIRRAAAQQRPFFIWASFHDPHPPYLVPAPWADLYDPAQVTVGRMQPGEHDRNPEHFRKAAIGNDGAWWQRVNEGEGAVHGGHPQHREEEELRKDVAAYYGMVSFVDRLIGLILDELDRLGLTGNTLVVFTADHGHFLGQHGLTAKAIHHYEDLIRVPFVVRWPGGVPAGRVSDHLQSLVDLVPTFLAAAGLEIPGRMTGVNQLPDWTEGREVRSWSVIENHHGYRRFHLRTYVNRRYKITVYREWETGELFDLDADPGETTNLWDDPECAGLKTKLLHAFLQATLQSEPVPMPRIAGA
jgi:arylsulfatase A-like enzyme